MPRQQAQGCQLAPLGLLHANLFKTLAACRPNIFSCCMQPTRCRQFRNERIPGVQSGATETGRVIEAQAITVCRFTSLHALSGIAMKTVLSSALHDAKKAASRRTTC
jgi:hypothetical protein